MSIKEQLQADFKEALKNKDQIKKSTITFIRSAIKQVEIDGQKELDDQGIIEVLSKQLKMRKDALEDFVKAGRQDLIDATNAEIEVIMGYLPKQLSKEELTGIVKAAVEKLKVTDLKQMGMVMKEVLPQVKGQADGKAVNEIVKEILSGNTDAK